MGRSKMVGMLAGLVLLAGGTARADEAAPSPIEWQAVIAGQIQAFRSHDAPRALSFAGASFHKSFADPEAFYTAILAAGYAPIVASTAQMFGPYELIAPDRVVQLVRLTGAGDGLYEAVYQLAREADGWRVEGVQLTKAPGLAV